jgi:hypothetical protein
MAIWRKRSRTRIATSPTSTAFRYFGTNTRSPSGRSSCALPAGSVARDHVTPYLASPEGEGFPPSPMGTLNIKTLSGRHFLSASTASPCCAVGCQPCLLPCRGSILGDNERDKGRSGSVFFGVNRGLAHSAGTQEHFATARTRHLRLTGSQSARRRGSKQPPVAIRTYPECPSLSSCTQVP